MAQYSNLANETNIYTKILVVHPQYATCTITQLWQKYNL